MKVSGVNMPNYEFASPLSLHNPNALIEDSLLRTRTDSTRNTARVRDKRTSTASVSYIPDFGIRALYWIGIYGKWGVRRTVNHIIGGAGIQPQILSY